MKITVFGGSAPKAGQPAYEEARRLGEMIAKAGHTAMTGGYMGTMEAVSRGAAEAGGHVIGATCAEIEEWRPTKPNPWVKEIWEYSTLGERLHALVARCDAAIALPGGAGTMAEISYMWNHLIIEALPARPLILVGKPWKDTFDCFYKNLGEYVATPDRGWLSFALNVEDAFDQMQTWFTVNHHTL
jgi:uncharacterized protein (TIGR00730 family)